MDRAIDPLQTIDAKLWADEFMATKQRLGDAEFDHAMMLGWFANAIMRGYDEGKRLGAADAQATIAALQARVQELEDDRSAWKEIAQDWSAAAKLAEQPEKFYEGYSAAVMNAMQALLTKARAEFTQRTAELEAAKADTKNMLDVATRRLHEQVNDLQAELERVRGELGETKLYLQQERANRDSLVACVNRDVKTIKELRTLLLALPKVEGEITCSQQFDSAWRLQYWQVEAYGVADECLYRLSNLREEEAKAYAALLKHRQGMEGQA